MATSISAGLIDGVGWMFLGLYSGMDFEVPDERLGDIRKIYVKFVLASVKRKNSLLEMSFTYFTLNKGF